MLRLAIIGAESLGVRGLCCLVTVEDRRILIDPGVSLGYIRHGLLPHPVQIAVGRRIRARIIEALAQATDVVISHFHGDHVPFADANRYQLALADLPGRPSAQRWWSISAPGSPAAMQRRFEDLACLLKDALQLSEGRSIGPMTFSGQAPHGVAGTRVGGVMMTRIEGGAGVFVHASDIQLLDDAAVDRILAWAPSIVLAAGPPLHLPSLSEDLRAAAFGNGVRLAREVETVILDHHVMRSLEGEQWLDEVSAAAGRRVYCAADYMGQPRQLLEARRQELYEVMPVPPDWHERYALGEVTVDPYVETAGAIWNHVRNRR